VVETPQHVVFLTGEENHNVVFWMEQKNHIVVIRPHDRRVDRAAAGCRGTTYLTKTVAVRFTKASASMAS